MTPFDSYAALDCRIELRRIHRAPVRYLHYAPTTSRAAPAVIVGSGNDSEIKCVGESEDVRLLSVNRSNPLGRGVAQLDCIEPGKSVQLILRQLVDVSRNREDEKRRRSCDS